MILQNNSDNDFKKMTRKGKPKGKGSKKNKGMVFINGKGLAQKGLLRKGF